VDNLKVDSLSMGYGPVVAACALRAGKHVISDTGTADWNLALTCLTGNYVERVSAARNVLARSASRIQPDHHLAAIDESQGHQPSAMK
jgi:hypothetical protein